MFDTKLANYVFSRNPPKRAAPGVEFVSEPVKAFVQHLPTTPGKHIWIPLMAPRYRDVPLHLRSVRKYPDGVVRLRYDVTTELPENG